MKILVSGGRNYQDRKKVREVLTLYDQMRPKPHMLINGGASGADQIAHDIAASLEWTVRTFYADWTKDGLSAGPKRNQRMLEEGKPDICIFFKGGKGTQDMLNKARYQGYKIHIVDHEELEKAKDK